MYAPINRDLKWIFQGVPQTDLLNYHNLNNQCRINLPLYFFLKNGTRSLFLGNNLNEIIKHCLQENLLKTVVCKLRNFAGKSLCWELQVFENLTKPSFLNDTMHHNRSFFSENYC